MAAANALQLDYVAWAIQEKSKDDVIMGILWINKANESKEWIIEKLKEMSEEDAQYIIDWFMQRRDNENRPLKSQIVRRILAQYFDLGL